jgi:hypothetical protein
VAKGTRLTYTLPAELLFVSASLTPISTTPLVWELGDLAARSGPLTVTAQIAPTATPLSALTSTAVLQTDNAELERHNNSAQGRTWVARFVYLPVIWR